MLTLCILKHIMHICEYRKPIYAYLKMHICAHLKMHITICIFILQICAYDLHIYVYDFLHICAYWWFAYFSIFKLIVHI